MKKIKKPTDKFSLQRLLNQYNKLVNYENSAPEEDEQMIKRVRMLKETILDRIKTNIGYKKVFLASEFGSELNKFCLEKFDINDVLKNIFGPVFHINTTKGLRSLYLN